MKKSDKNLKEIRAVHAQSVPLGEAEVHLLDLRQQIENAIQECIARPASRLFRIGRESYLIYSGSTPEDQTPYILLGNSENLPPEIIERLEYLLISDNLLGDIFSEKELLKQLQPRKNGLMRLVGDAATIKNLLKFFQMDDIEYLVPQKHSRRGHEVEIQPHQSMEGQRQRERIIASFYENGNIRVTSQKKIVLDLRSELQHGLNLLNEIRIADKITTKWENKHLKRGFFNIAGDLVLHDAKNFMVFDSQNQDILLRLGLWGLNSSNCKGIFFHKTQEKGSFLHSFRKILHKVWIITKNKSIVHYEQFFNKDGVIKIFQSDEQISLSNYYTMELRLDESRFFLSPGKRYHDIEVNLSDFESSFDARIVLADRPVVKVPKERQIWIYRTDFPVKFYHPYILAFPENYRYELRKIHKYIDVGELEAELREWADASNDSFPRPLWREFVHELINTVERLQVNAFQNYEVDLGGMLKAYKKSNFGNSKEAWKNLISFNRLLLRWQLSGRRETFDTQGILAALRKEGFPHFGMIILFDDGQLITMYLPERLPGAYITGMAHPLAWQITDLLHVKSYETIRDKILISDLIYFLKLFEEQIKAAPITDIQQNNWREGYAQWLQYYIQVYRDILQDLMRLETLYHALSDFSQTQWEINQTNSQKLSKLFPSNLAVGGEKTQIRDETHLKQIQDIGIVDKKQETFLKKEKDHSINKDFTDSFQNAFPKLNASEENRTIKQEKTKESFPSLLENSDNESIKKQEHPSHFVNKIVVFLRSIFLQKKSNNEINPGSVDQGEHHIDSDTIFSKTYTALSNDLFLKQEKNTLGQKNKLSTQSDSQSTIEKKDITGTKETKHSIKINDIKENRTKKLAKAKRFFALASFFAFLGIGLWVWFFLFSLGGSKTVGVQKADYALSSASSWLTEGGKKAATDGLTVSLKPDKFANQNWQWLLDRHPFLPSLRQFFRDDFNYNPSILVYLNRMAVINGYVPYSPQKNRRVEQGKNPHWIYPEKRLTKPDQSIWIVKRGQNFWRISEIELKKRAQFFLYYLAYLDLALEELSKMRGYASVMPILHKYTFLLLKAKKNPQKLNGRENFSQKNIAQWLEKQEMAQSFWAERLLFTGTENKSKAQMRKSLAEVLRYEQDYESRYKQELPELRSSPESFGIYINFMKELAGNYSFSETQKNLFILRTTLYDFLSQKRKK